MSRPRPALRVEQLLETLAGRLQVGRDVPRAAGLARAHSDSREIAPGDLFIALPGVRSQGTDYLEAAFDAGCLAALVPAGAEVPAALRARCIAVERIRHNAARAAGAVYGHPAEALLTFGVTGTNGKTSTCHLLKHLLEAAGHRVVMVTTVAHEFGDWRRETPNTTPDACVLQNVLATARERGASAAVIEVSAHGVALERVGGCRFDGLAFTNLALDHQDFFDGIEPYFAAKETLFTAGGFHKPGCVAAIGCDDEFGRRLFDAGRVPAWSFGLAPGPTRRHVDAGRLELAAEGIHGELAVGKVRLAVDTTLTGAFNRLNLAGAGALAVAAGLPTGRLEKALQQPIAVPGRLMSVPSAAPFRVVVDFAHTEAALANLLTGLRTECAGRLIVVFGAGGDKDPARRRTLPAVVIRQADVAVITLDNPRSESPQVIIDAMVANWRELEAGGAGTAAMQVEPDRRRAIATALAWARPGDIVVLAGKGHETTQIHPDRVEHHDDHAVAAEWLQQRYGKAPSRKRA